MIRRLKFRDLFPHRVLIGLLLAGILISVMCCTNKLHRHDLLEIVKGYAETMLEYGIDQEKVVIKYEMNNCIHEKGYRNKPLTDEQKKQNRDKSKTRAKVEHVFGFMEQSMNGLAVKSVGIARASGIVGLINLTYNLFRYEQVIRLNIMQINN